MYNRFNNYHDNLEIYKYYQNSTNIKISSGGGIESDKVIIFFTGHGLYYPTSIEKFCEEVILNDKYEWQNISKDSRILSSVSEFIYVRDVYKNWCLEGINGTINTQDKVKERLKEIISERKVITVGSSAVGYMAILFGILLDAETIYTFSPQVNLYEYYMDHPYEYFEEYKKNPATRKYMDLKGLMSKYSGNLLYWYPVRCEEDVRQYNSVKDCKNVHFFTMSGSKHGETLWGESFIQTLSMPVERVVEVSRKYEGKVISPFTYCCETSGIVKATAIKVGKTIRNLISKK